ncbi:MAG: glycosyltransferase [Betaproteobacteria bacterium]|nr:glycosyltransferase [Betaproteobacteria bacterium]
MDRSVLARTMTLPPAASPSFSIFYAGDAYSTAQKIMGRQSAGKQLIAGLARKYPESRITGLGPALQSKTALEKQLRAGGHKGDLAFELLPQAELLSELGTLYYPAPPTRELAYWRQRLGAQQIFSVMGVTHTLASKSASDQIADLVLPPFEDWDALICTSKAAQRFTENLQAEMRDYLRDAIGATHFSRPLAALKLSAVPKSPANDEQSRGARLGSGAAIVCLEAGVFPNEHIKNSFMTAQGAIAPHVRFIHIPGQDEAAYRMGWQAADVFVSLSDNVQETFGLTPVEAMAAGLPVLISDWNGYQDTVRHHVDGFKVPTIQAPAGAGELLALRHMLDVDSYDMYIGRASLATVVEPVALAEATLALASNHSLRQQMGAEGQRRALADFDWAVILDRYDDLARELRSIRQASKTTASRTFQVVRSNPTGWFGLLRWHLNVLT